MYAHLRRGSLTVRPGDRVRAGQADRPLRQLRQLHRAARALPADGRPGPGRGPRHPLHLAEHRGARQRRDVHGSAQRGAGRAPSHDRPSRSPSRRSPWLRLGSPPCPRPRSDAPVRTTPPRSAPRCSPSSGTYGRRVRGLTDEQLARPDAARGLDRTGVGRAPHDGCRRRSAGTSTGRSPAKRELALLDWPFATADAGRRHRRRHPRTRRAPTPTSTRSTPAPRSASPSAWPRAPGRPAARHAHRRHDPRRLSRHPHRRTRRPHRRPEPRPSRASTSRTTARRSPPAPGCSPTRSP